MKIIDAFIFYNEEKMLDFRLKYYANTVDYFVIVEANKTFSGVDKPSFFNTIKDRYSHLNIIHYIVEDMPSSVPSDSSQGIEWHREHHQRECIKRALKIVPNIQDEDWVLIADTDEIANRDKLLTVKNSDLYSAFERVGYTLEFDNYYYNIESRLDQKCYATKLLRYGELKDKELRGLRFSVGIYPLLIEFGWHFSYFFSPEMIKNKIQSFSHQEYNEEKFTNKEHVEDCIKNGKSLFYLDPSRTEKIYHIPHTINKNLPQGYEMLI